MPLLPMMFHPPLPKPVQNSADNTTSKDRRRNPRRRHKPWRGCRTLRVVELMLQCKGTWRWMAPTNPTAGGSPDSRDRHKEPVASPIQLQDPGTTTPGYSAVMFREVVCNCQRSLWPCISKIDLLVLLNVVRNGLDYYSWLKRGRCRVAEFKPLHLQLLRRLRKCRRTTVTSAKWL